MWRRPRTGPEKSRRGLAAREKIGETIKHTFNNESARENRGRAVGSRVVRTSESWSEVPARMQGGPSAMQGPQRSVHRTGGRGLVAALLIGALPVCPAIAQSAPDATAPVAAAPQTA